MSRVRKVVIPVAGAGTRFLPVTKAMPKEMLPIVDIPTVQLNVEECVASGIEEIIFVTARGKGAIEDHFDRAGDLESLLERKGRTADVEALRRLTTMAKFVSVRQGEPRGLGHAVLCARAAVGDEPFAVLLGDDLVVAQPPGLAQLLDVHAREGLGVVGLQEVPAGQEHLYGVVGGEPMAGRWRSDRGSDLSPLGVGGEARARDGSVADGDRRTICLAARNLSDPRTHAAGARRRDSIDRRAGDVVRGARVVWGRDQGPPL